MAAPRTIAPPHVLLPLLMACALHTGGVRAQPSSLTAAPQLTAIYDAILDARFGDVAALHAAACSPRTPNGTSRLTRGGPPADERAPAEVCQLLDAVALWWQIQLDPADTSRDSAAAARVDAAIAAADAWTVREPRRAESWFYLGGAYGLRVQLNIRGREWLSAARDGTRAKDALEKALALDGTIQDAYFGIGLYHYYADVGSRALRILRWLLALPGGDKTRGLQEMLRARQHGQLLRDEADFHLHLISLWFEKQPHRGRELLNGLRERHPANPLFAQLAAEIEDAYLHDHASSLRTWRDLLERARARQVAEPRMTEVRARLGMSAELDHLFETDRAVEELRHVAGLKPVAPYGAAAQTELQLAQALDRLGDRTAAVSRYRAAIAAAPPRDPLGTLDRARSGLRHAPDADAALAYRLSLEGWRAFERGALEQASTALSRSLMLRPDDPVTRYRQARLMESRGEDAEARALYESVLNTVDPPPTFSADAALGAARIYERRRAPSRARELYQRARTTPGAHARTRDEAERALERLDP